jgi:hypothetical protein
MGPSPQSLTRLCQSLTRLYQSLTRLYQSLMRLHILHRMPRVLIRKRFLFPSLWIITQEDEPHYGSLNTEGVEPAHLKRETIASAYCKQSLLIYLIYLIIRHEAPRERPQTHRRENGRRHIAERKAADTPPRERPQTYRREKGR